MNADFISHDDARWRQFLKNTKHDCYHLPEYAEIAAADEDALPTAFYAEDGQAACLIPLLVRPIPAALNAPADWFDCASPYGYSGIVTSPSEERWEPFLDAFRSAARARGIVSAFIRLHPLFPLHREALEPAGRLVRHGRTVFIDLSTPKESVWLQVSSNHRRNIRRLVRSGFQCSLDEWSRLPEFVDMYHATMRRVGAPQSYFFSPRYFESLRDKLGPRVHLACVLSPSGELAAGSLLIVTEGIVEYHLGGSADRYLPLAPSKLAMDFIWRWSQEQAYDILHLGGGVGAVEDSLFHFKAGFSPARGEFYTYRLVIDERKHAALQQMAHSVRRAAANGDFFPAYRCLPNGPPAMPRSESPQSVTLSGC
ncbi:GNAT family N-acetyltransferase [Nitrospira moscoviensis]|uniref:BioF2-like acetyltransferase domain-containing protein n=1 Tax=Nitrospira moscoviensis TaxID=42253 RepID=A0A0K2GII2_NITMO|nr:GNAT family N-acetyltransferase [Nitrospira moscoviensis]ALA60751.1 hypothetical protein NITMOv2_4376 [Nitrospira moscoviensis]